MELGGPNHLEEGWKKSFAGLCVPSLCLLSNLWPLQICFAALGVTWSPLRMATSLPFVFKNRNLFAANPDASLTGISGHKIEGFSVAGLLERGTGGRRGERPYSPRAQLPGLPLASLVPSGVSSLQL